MLLVLAMASAFDSTSEVCTSSTGSPDLGKYEACLLP